MDHLDLLSEILASHGVHVQADLFRNITDDKQQHNLQLWKATHDLLIVTLFFNAHASLHQSNIRLAWKEFAKRGPNAVRFESIKSFVQVQLVHFGYAKDLATNATMHDLLSAFIWLIAKCELVEQYVNAKCRETLRHLPFLAVRGNRVWRECSNNTLSTVSSNPAPAPTNAHVAPPTVPDLTHRVALQCGALWHAVREMATVEERRTKLLQRICEQQVALRPSASSRLLLPIEVNVAVAMDTSNNKRIQLDQHIEAMKKIVTTHELAMKFWQWCSTVLNVSEVSSNINDGGPGNVSAGASSATFNEEAVLKEIEDLIVEGFGLMLRKP